MASIKTLIALLCIFFVSITPVYAIIEDSTWIQLSKKVAPAVVVVTAEFPRENTKQKNLQPIPISDTYSKEVFIYPYLSLEEYTETQAIPVRKGTGTVIHQNGFVLTNNHVAGGATAIRIAFEDGREYDARVIATEPRNDAALLRIISSRTNFPFLSVVPMSSIKRGMWYMNLSHPYGLVFSAFSGIISSTPPEIRIDPAALNKDFIFRASGVFAPGTSGSPLVNLEGQMFGMIFASVNDTYFPGLAFSAEPILADFRAKGFLPPRSF